jgi:hypothetical protein
MLAGGCSSTVAAHSGTSIQAAGYFVAAGVCAGITPVTPYAVLRASAQGAFACTSSVVSVARRTAFTSCVVTAASDVTGVGLPVRCDSSAVTVTGSLASTGIRIQQATAVCTNVVDIVCAAAGLFRAYLSIGASACPVATCIRVQSTSGTSDSICGAVASAWASHPPLCGVIIAPCRTSWYVGAGFPRHAHVSDTVWGGLITVENWGAVVTQTPYGARVVA